MQITALDNDGVPKLNTSRWMSNVANTSVMRTKVILDEPDQPILSPEPSLPSSMTNQYISIQMSSIKKDAAQTPVPFFDAQEVIESTDITLIRGLGIFHKGRPGWGGFLAFRIVSMPDADIPSNNTYDLWQILRKPVL